MKPLVNKITLLLVLTLIPAISFSQNLTFNQLVGILQKLNNNNHSILNVISNDLKVNSVAWQPDTREATLLMQDTPLESFVYAWSFKVNNQEQYRLGVSKSPINGKVFTSLSYWFPSIDVYNSIKYKAIEFGAVETNKKIDEDGTISFLYKTANYQLILVETPPERSDITINGKRVISYQAIIGYR